MNRSLVAALVLLAAGVAGCLGADDPSTEPAASQEAAPAPAPTPSEPTHWKAGNCTAVSLVWTPPREDLEPLVGPWTPAEGPVPGRGIFVLFASQCPRSGVGGNASGPDRVGAAVVPVEEPARGPGAPEDAGWISLPQVVAPEGPVYGLFEGHAFPTTRGDVAVDVQRTDAGGQASMTYETPNGTVEARTTFDGSGTVLEDQTALVTPSRDPLGVAVGPEERTRYTGDGLVRSQGETWVSRLDLSPTPVSVAVDLDFSWDFGFRLER